MRVCFQCGNRCINKFPIYDENNEIIGYHCKLCAPGNAQAVEERKKQRDAEYRQTEKGRDAVNRAVKAYKQKRFGIGLSS